MGIVLKDLKTHRFCAKASKCSIMIQEVKLLRKWIMPQWEAPIKEKMKAIAE